MALPETKAGYEVLLELESTTSPATYQYVCGIMSTEINFNSELIANNVRDCAQPAAPAVRVVKPGTKSVGVTGSGLFAKEFEDELWGVFSGGVRRNWRVSIVGGPRYTGSFAMTQWSIGANAEDNSLATCSIALEANGIPTRVSSWA